MIGNRCDRDNELKFYFLRLFFVNCLNSYRNIKYKKVYETCLWIIRNVNIYIKLL